MTFIKILVYAFLYYQSAHKIIDSMEVKHILMLYFGKISSSLILIMAEKNEFSNFPLKNDKLL